LRHREDFIEQKVYEYLQTSIFAVEEFVGNFPGIHGKEEDVASSTENVEINITDRNGAVIVSIQHNHDPCYFWRQHHPKK